ncbi:MAG: protein kinase domain-containing protein [Usitatibacter sp.]
MSAALDMEPGARGPWLEGIDATHPEAAPVLRRLLASDDRGQRSREFETVPRLASLPGGSSAHAAGERLGPFELVRPLGRGGMGEVWLARQVDGRVQREVALKLPALLQHGEVWRQRFRRERDILARLEHPHIARFYDAGVADSGQPWLAMECVFGMTLLEHATARGLSIPQRLALFRQVLAAVAHAHRHLVVHRDLKPGNVLVDESGVVKLLDFGIAKLVEDGADADTSGELTRLGGRMMTLRYAAPEQVAAGGITTATDIYALGVMLHELLTGLSPYRAVREGKPLTEAMLLEEHSTLPSRLAPKPLARILSGDLDAIVLKAMRKDPAQRYGSVELFDADIVAFLQRRPVKARAGTWRYLAGRFAVRHKLPLALASAVLVTLVAGLVVAEGERRKAVAEKARAERHFASVRKLANTFIYEVHGKIENLPGSLEARELLIATSLEYLDALAREPGRDPSLLFEIASAYRSIGNIQGQPREANRGNLAASIANFEKSGALLEELERLKPGDIAAVREHWRTSYALTGAYFQVADARWRAEMRRTIELAERISATAGASVDDRSLAAFTRAREAHLISIATGRTPEAEATLVDAIAVFEGLRAEAPPEAALHERLALLYRNAGVVLAGPGEGPPRMREAIAYLEKAVAITRERSAEVPDDRNRQSMERVTTLVLARHLAANGDLRRADALMAEVTARVDRMVARDPDDVTLAVNRLEILVGAADAANRLRDHPRAMRLCREVLASAAKLPKESSRLRDVRIQTAEAKVVLGYALLATAEAGKLDRERRLAMLVEARSLFGDVSQFLEDVRAEPTLGAVPEYKLREFAQARARLDQAFAKIAAR